MRERKINEVARPRWLFSPQLLWFGTGQPLPSVHHTYRLIKPQNQRKPRQRGVHILGYMHFKVAWLEKFIRSPCFTFVSFTKLPEHHVQASSQRKTYGKFLVLTIGNWTFPLASSTAPLFDLVHCLGGLWRKYPPMFIVQSIHNSASLLGTLRALRGEMGRACETRGSPSYSLPKRLLNFRVFAQSLTTKVHPAGLGYHQVEPKRPSNMFHRFLCRRIA